MTDKEMSEEYCNTHIPVAFTYLIKKKATRDKIENLYSEELKQAYLAGLKAGRPEWHKVADGDLPPTSGEMHAERYPILACTKNGYVTVAIRRKHGRAYEWFCSDYDGNTLYLDKEVIAWCEIPKYTEE